MKLYDIKAAYQAISRESIADAYVDVDLFLLPFLMQHLHEHKCMIQVSDAMPLVKLSDGVGQGSVLATDFFNKGYRRATDCTLDFSIRRGATLVAESPLDAAPISTALTTFIDDVAQRLAVQDNMRVHECSNVTADAFDHSLSLVGVDQNRSKAEDLYTLTGANARTATRSLASAGKPAKREPRYLGPHFSWNGSTRSEVDRRIRSAHKAFYG